jgi:hypothetical protein
MTDAESESRAAPLAQAAARLFATVEALRVARERYDAHDAARPARANTPPLAAATVEAWGAWYATRRDLRRQITTAARERDAALDEWAAAFAQLPLALTRGGGTDGDRTR